MFGIPWHKLPTPLALLRLIQFRDKLRQQNLHDTSQIPNQDELPQPIPSPDGRHLKLRTIDGSFNDLEHPEMGMAGTRMGRNVPLNDAKFDEKNLLMPNPRTVSQVLLTRDKFHPATILNLHAASWIQFQTHDWFTHGDSQPPGEPDHAVEIPLEENDPWPQEYRPLAIRKTLADPTRHDGNNNPPTFISKVTHWWDASQIYGSEQETADRLRSHMNEKMRIDDNGFLPLNDHGNDDVGFLGTWWLGLSMLHTLFVKEHNTICDHLKQRYPNWSDDELFDHARLITPPYWQKFIRLIGHLPSFPILPQPLP
jgi:hypothetical protein